MQACNLKRSGERAVFLSTVVFFLLFFYLKASLRQCICINWNLSRYYQDCGGSVQCTNMQCPAKELLGTASRNFIRDTNMLGSSRGLGPPRWSGNRRDQLHRSS